ncbi:MAG: TauD/TfdA dioxygenase family protein [Advenella sp.]|uniref:TauD/TfdA dioxygenase family protein n=1 Tax=Advenella sp. S44 TaxID=1982755 RepID=UPI001F5B02E5|nr:TauD/TfdA family dioxygenase [Advenella sp. S44]
MQALAIQYYRHKEDCIVDVCPTGSTLGARVRGIDLSNPLSDMDFSQIVMSLGRYGVLHFPQQKLNAIELKAFSERFGGLQTSVTGKFCDPNVPEVGILSNIVENGVPIGLADAGQDWHTDMSYNATIGFANVLYALKIPHRNHRALGSTHFANMHAAYDDLPIAFVQRLADATVTHDFNKFWEEMRQRSDSPRPALTAEQRAKRPPSRHPLFLTHPITGKPVLYANPGYAVRINELSEKESNAILDFLFEHQLQAKYQYVHDWSEGDVLMWDHIGTLHNAVPDYEPEEHRLIKRCQIKADKVFDPSFMTSVNSHLSLKDDKK